MNVPLPVNIPFHLSSIVREVRNVNIEVRTDYLCLYHKVLDLFLLAWHSELQI